MLFYYNQIFLQSEIDLLIQNDLLVDAVNGGLIIGPSHDKNGINFILKDRDVYRLKGNVEGFEYILPGNNYRGLLKHDLHELYEHETFQEYIPPESITILNCYTQHPNYNSKILLLHDWDTLSIINKKSTRKNLFYLEEMRLLNHT